jgi:phasin family protein
MMLDYWKRPLDYGFRVMQQVIEGSMKIRELQLETATQAHADAEATRRAIAAATDVGELARLQTEWARSNAERSFAYWRAVSQAVMETDAALVRCACAEAAIPLPEAYKAGDLEASKQALLGMVDSAYKQWLDAAQRFYRPAEKAAA